MQRMIGLPAVHLNVTLGAYVAAIKLARDNPDQEFKHGLTSWWPTSGREIMQQFMRSVHERINDAIPYCQRGIRP